VSADTHNFSPDAFAERLRQIRKATGLTGARIAQQGSITKQTFSGYLHTGRLPSAAVLANWVFRLGINANWLLTGEGPIMLDQTEAIAPDPVVQRVAVVVSSMREAGAEERDILLSVRAMLEGELAKLGCARSGHAEAGPTALAPELSEPRPMPELTPSRSELSALDNAEGAKN